MAAIVVGNYLYIDGGEIGMWDGQVGSTVTAKENDTLSIDLSVSWNNASVSINTISKGNAPVVNTGALWTGPMGDSFYLYDGGLGLYVDLSQDPPASNDLWQFTPAGASGEWSQATFPPSSNFSDLIRTTDGIYASSGDGLGFALGGHVDSYTVADVQTAFNVSGMVVYNSTSQEWYNISSSGYSYEAGISRGQGHFVPTFGPAGVLLIFGGTAGNDYATFDYAYIYEPISQQWKWQQTSGDIPAGVARPCVVGIDSGNGTYEIFLYGGVGSDYATSKGATSPYVLSLPSFIWSKKDMSSDYSRNGHTCNIIGNSQMVVIGGTINADSPGQEDISGAVDPWTNGIGIFDLSDMEWKGSYDANAGPYVTPAIVQARIDQQTYPEKWSDPMVQEWFTQKARNNSSPVVPNSQHGSNAGAIAGGVVGGVVALLLLIAIFWYFMRRRRRTKNIGLEEKHPEFPRPTEIEGIPRSELAAKESPKEADGVPRSELPVGERHVVELPGNE